MKKNLLFSLSFFLFFTFLILGLNLAPTFYFVKNSPPDRSFTMVHNNSQDYYFYLSLMREGASGKWLTTIPFTTEAHSPSLIFTFFLVTGKLFSSLGISMETGYLISRIFSSILFFSSAFLLIRKLKIPHPLFTYFFFLFASPFLMTTAQNGQETITPYLYWWTGIDAIRRSSYLPHHMFGGFLLIITLILIINFIESGKIKYFVFSLLLIVPLLFIHTPSLLILIMVLPTSAVGYWVTTLKNKTNNITQTNNDPLVKIPKQFFLIFYSFLGTVIMLVFAGFMQSDPLWKHALEWEKTLQLSFMKEMAGAFGLLLPFAFIGIIRSLFSRKFSYLLIVCWFVVPILMIPLAPFFQISNTRLVQGIPFLPFAMLTSIGIDGIIKSIKLKNLLYHQGAKIRKFPSWINKEKIVWGAVLILFTLQTLPTLIWSIKDQVHEYATPYSNIYLDKRLFLAFDFINNEYEPGTITLSSFYTGNYLPAFTNTISYIGHFGYTYNLTEKEEKTNSFFGTQLSEENAAEFLKENNIKLIFQGPEEKRMTAKALYPSFLRTVFSNDIVTIYQPRI